MLHPAIHAPSAPVRLLTVRLLTVRLLTVRLLTVRLLTVLLACLLAVASSSPRAVAAQAPPPPPVEAEEAVEVPRRQEDPVRERAGARAESGSAAARAAAGTDVAIGRPLRIVGELAAGAGGSLVGLAGGGALGVASGLLLYPDDGWAVLGMMALGGFVGTVTMAPLSVALVGDAMGGNGSWWATFLGYGAGVGLSFVAANALVESEEENLIFPLLLVVPLSSAVLGYELTSDSGGAADAAAATGVALPFVGTSPRGEAVLMGLSGAW